MLRKRTRSVTSKQAIVGDHNNNNNNPWLPPEKPTKPSSFFFTSPKFFKGFFGSPGKPDPMMSPNSILDSNPFSAVANLWVSDNTTKNISNNNNNNNNNNTRKHSWERPNDKQGIGLALIDENLETNNTKTNNNNNNNNSDNNITENKQQKRKLVVFGSQLRIQVPQLPTTTSVFPCFSPESPREFGIKTPKNNLWPFGKNDLNSQVHPDDYESSSIDIIDEQSEDYTCVISHGPNPKTTHIFGNCIVENCCGKIVKSPSISSKRNGYLSSLENSTPKHVNFLSFCHHCMKKLGEGRDIYMYRGEKAFCSEECRGKEMLLDDAEK